MSQTDASISGFGNGILYRLLQQQKKRDKAGAAWGGPAFNSTKKNWGGWVKFMCI